MSDAGKKRGLGRGLSALMDDVGMDALVETDAPEIPIKTSIETSIKTSGEPTPKHTPEPKAKTPKKTPEKKTKPTPKSKDKKPEPDVTLEKSISYIPMDQLTRNPDQPRRYFDNQLLEELSESIRDKGVLQPVLVRPLPDRLSAGDSKIAYQIIAGERRWQAALKAGLETIPVFIREITDREALEIGVVENVHRTDLNPMEEALAYKSLLTQFERTQADVAQAVGKSRPYIANMLRLLNLPERVQTYLAEGKITTGHARAIIAAPNPQQLADAIVEHDLSVRDAENLVRRMKTEATAPSITKASKAQKAADIRQLEEKLTDALGLTVDLRDKNGRGELRLKYKSIDQLEELIKILTK